MEVNIRHDWSNTGLTQGEEKKREWTEDSCRDKSREEGLLVADEELLMAVHTDKEDAGGER